MAAVTRIGDLNSGHDLCPPVPLNSGSHNVFANNIPVGRVGDSYQVHSCPDHLPHAGNLDSGSSTVFANGKPLSRIGDAVSCGGTAAQGSQNVFAG